MENLQGFLSNPSVNTKVNIEGVLYLKCPEKICTERVLARGDRAGAIKRKDDNLSILKKRFASFENETKQVLIEFELRKIPIFEVDTILSVEQVFENIVKREIISS